MRIAIICHGNICRSPMAETVAAALIAEARLGADVTVESFGTSGCHAGQSADHRAEDALTRARWPSRAHRARQLTTESLAAADLVLCADRSNLAAVRRLGRALAGPGLTGDLDGDKVRLLRSFDPSAVPGDDEVPDPWNGGDAEFDRALRLIERSCTGLVVALTSARR